MPTRDHSERYTGYLQSAAWQRRRLRAMEAADWRCSQCGATSLLQVHHRTYERLGQERDGDLIVLCEPCHQGADAARAQWNARGAATGDLRHWAPDPGAAQAKAAFKAWIDRTGEALITQWQDQLWGPVGAKALAWLRGPERGLTDETIRTARLGYCPADGTAGRRSVARGITIPLIGADGNIHGVRIRRPVPRDAPGADGRYVCLPGSCACVYGRTQRRHTLLVVESEFDCLLAQQILGDAVDVAATSLGNPDGHWLWHLVGIPTILVCLDSDEAGQQGWQRWQGFAAARKVLLPRGKDVTAAVVDHGLDLPAWLSAQVAPEDDTSTVATVELPAEATRRDAWLEDGDATAF